MRFYVPEWEDHVDADYDFITDEHSSVSRKDRNLAYIWDIFDRDPTATPIDGILISREQIEESPERARQLKDYGIYGAPEEETTLTVPKWLPTISDCGAWGYKQLPFPRYGNEEMLSFYENLDVDVGVTIDHLVLGSSHTARLYLDENELPSDFGPSDLPDAITDYVDVMVDNWPDEWPDNVEQYEPSIVDYDPPATPLSSRLESGLTELNPSAEPPEREQRVKGHLESIADDPRLVYRKDDMEFRYDLTLENLREMRELYDAGDYSFRLMCAIQGWDTSSYAKATRAALSAGYDYLGIGGVAGTTEKSVEQYVASVGEVVHDFEQAHETRVDTHIFGFAKTGAFDTIGRSGMSSFDSASMLRSAWTGGGNYHLDTADSTRRFDAFRVRYPGHSGELTGAIERALWSQEMLAALRAYDTGDSIPDAVRQWHDRARRSIEELGDYLAANRWAAVYKQDRITDMVTAFRTEYEHAGDLAANFSDRFRKRLLNLLRDDSPEEALPFERYEELLKEARARLDTFPRSLERLEGQVQAGTPAASLETLWTVVEAYTAALGDKDHRGGYRELLRERPWEECDCPICTELGIEVAIFRGNNRNRRRGFHNTRRFYDQFKRQLPKLLVLTRGNSSLSGASMVSEFLAAQRPDFWSQVHDLPVVEIGAVTAKGVHEWWETPPETLSFAPGRLVDRVTEHCQRYQGVFIDGANWDPPAGLREELAAVDCEVTVSEDPAMLRDTVLHRLGYDERTLPAHPHRIEADQVGIQDFH